MADLTTNTTSTTTTPGTGTQTPIPIQTPTAVNAIPTAEKAPTSFDVIMQNCPFLKGIIENKIQSEVASRDQKITALEKTIDELTATILMGGAK